MSTATPTILIIDDEPAMGRTMKRLTEAHFPTFRVVWAASGVMALDLARTYAESLRLIVLDANMPVFSGQLAAVQLRAMLPTVPILAFSSYPEMLPPLAAMGCVETALKRPADMGELPARMRRAMSAQIAPLPGSPYLTAMQQSGDLVLSFVREQLGGDHGAGRPSDDHDVITKACTRLDQYCRRFPQPAREVQQALKELRQLID